ncbi:MAG: 6-carboxytetrahydropterin synthase [Gemmatimonadetes bacterium]|nr:MAG: 6-carboxytetrahydropterin synthase [Gemmatimonadota bacterium]
MPRVRVTREVHFNAAHRVFNPAWDDARNLEVFGGCANPEWHGHNYELFVTVEGELDPETGYVMDLRALKELVEERVVADVDHCNLNTQVPWMQGVIPSSENFVVRIWERLEGHLPAGVRLARLTLWETPRHYVEYEGG